MKYSVALLICSAWLFPMSATSQDLESNENQELSLVLRSRKPTELNSSRFGFEFRNEKWKPAETAIIVCDFWDYHHCLNAVRRMKEFGPRLNEVINKARKMGVTIVHSPSDCMDSYSDHPSRKKTLAVPQIDTPDFARYWCSQIPEEEKAVYPIDQSDGGEDDDPDEHKEWAAKLKKLGRNPSLPWKKQNDMIPIDQDQDYISDRGDEVYRVLQHQGIKNVILVGVHTNMCVLGRPFGLRQMKRFGMNVVLMRDMSDSMYNPKRWPFVSHYEGHGRVIAHVEKHVCPTISSDQILGGKEFSFASDPRPHMAIVIGESEYKTEQTLPDFAESNLSDLRISFVFANSEDRNDFPFLDKVKDADLMLLSVRRRVLRPEQMKVFREFEAAKKPILGIRTASHAFCLRNKKPPEGYVDWVAFDSEVFGGNYTNHHGNQLKSSVVYTELAVKHPITRRLASEDDFGDPKKNSRLKSFGQGGSLYKTSPLAEGADVLLRGTVLGHPSEPTAWTFKRVNGGKSFYTSLGHPKDFDNEEFVALLKSAIHWSADLKVASSSSRNSKKYWRVQQGTGIPKTRKLLKFDFESKEKLTGLHTHVAFRKVLNIPGSWEGKSIKIRTPGNALKAWLNGNALAMGEDGNGKYFKLMPDQIAFDDANWLVLGCRFYDKSDYDRSTVSVETREGTKKIVGDWEWIQAEKSFSESSQIHLPAKFGGSPRIYQSLE